MQKEKNISEPDSSRTIIIVVAIAAALLIGGLFYLLMRKSVTGDATTPRLASALRAGNPEFEKYKSQIVLDDPQADESKRALGDWVMTLKTTVRNLTGRTITGLEIRGVVVDHQNQVVKERTVVVIPVKQQSELEPNKTVFAAVLLDRMTDEDDRANIKMEVAGVTFKP
jgi:hypothetical protein